MTDIRLLPATVESLLALQLDPPASSEVRCPTLPEFPESIGFSIDRLRTHRDETDWGCISSSPMTD